VPKNRSRRPLPTRREFLGTLAGAMAFAPEVLAMQKPGPSGIPRRPLGRSGDSVSIVGFGGWDAGVHEREKDAIALIHEAIDGGITFFDNAWEYHDGRSEEIVGRALESGGRRDRVFVMTKVCARDYAGFQRQFEQSLRRLRTDHVDLLQFHRFQYADDARRIFDPEMAAAQDGHIEEYKNRQGGYGCSYQSAVLKANG